MTVNLYPHQKKAVSELSNGKILWGGVGTGKSLTAAAYYMAKETPQDVYVITTAKKRDSLDWEKEFAKFAIGKTRDATMAGVLTVDSWNNIGKYTGVEGSFFIFDEQRAVGSGEWSSYFIEIVRRNRWILLSATPGDTWMDYVPVFIANGFYKNRAQFKREHVVYNPFTKFPKVDRYTGTGKLARLRNSILVEMLYKMPATRHSRIIDVEYDKELFDEVVKKRWHVYKNRPLQGIAELFGVMRKVVNSDPSRLVQLQYLMDRHPRLIVFYNFDYELEILRLLTGNQLESGTSGVSDLEILSEIKGKTWQTQTHAGIASFAYESATNSNLLSNAQVVKPISPIQKREKGDSTNRISSTISGSEFQIAEWNGHKHQPIPESDSWVYLVQYAAGAMAWNCITTNATVFYSLPYSYKLWAQAHGRIDRLSTPFENLYYYSLRSKSLIDLAIAKALAEKENFNESQFSV